MSATIPTIVAHLGFVSSLDMRFPSASPLGKYFFANAWLTITTGAESAVSASLKKRPFNSGVCSTRKIPGVMSRISSSGNAPPAFGSCPSIIKELSVFEPLNGSIIVNAEYWTPGIFLIRRSASA